MAFPWITLARDPTVFMIYFDLFDTCNQYNK